MPACCHQGRREQPTVANGQRGTSLFGRGAGPIAPTSRHCPGGRAPSYRAGSSRPPRTAVDVTATETRGGAQATPDLPAVQPTLAQADALLVQIDRDIDFLSWELRPAALDDLGLKAVLENYVREWSRHSNVPARFHAEGVADERVAPEIEATMYRIAQEALNNVAKHAHARSVGVVLEQRGQTLCWWSKTMASDSSLRRPPPR